MPGEAWTAAGLVIVAIITWIAAPVVKDWLDKRKPETPTPVAQPQAVNHGDRALDEVFDQLDETKAELADERVAHNVTRADYIEVVQRLARVEAQAESLRESNDAKDIVIQEMRAELASLRAEIKELRARG